MAKKKFWSIWDEQVQKYMETGKNSPTLKEAVEDLWGWWSGASDLEEKDLRKMEKWDWKEKQDWLEGTDFKFVQHSKKLKKVI